MAEAEARPDERRMTAPHSDSLDLLEQDAFVKEARRVCRCLFIQVPESVARNVQMKVEAAFGSLLSRLETLTRERDDAQEKFLRLGEAYNFLYHEHGALSGKFLHLESENARMTEVLEAALEWSKHRDGWPSPTDKALENALVEYTLARASRTQFPDANREENNGN